MLHGVQSVHGVEESGRQSRGEAGIRALKALRTGIITTAGSKLAGGEIAGEIGKRLTNRIANGTVQAVTRLKALCFELTCFVNQVAHDGL